MHFSQLFERIDNNLINSQEVHKLECMRIQHLNQDTCNRLDLLSTLHSNPSLLVHAHNIEIWGLKYWLMNSDTYPGNFAGACHSLPGCSRDKWEFLIGTHADHHI